jgi:phosphoglycolate phosphatase
MALKLVVFDWNATILSDTRACWAADNHVIKTFGGKPITLAEYRKTIDIPAIGFYIQHGADPKKLRDRQNLARVFGTFYERRAAKCRTRGGAKKLLEWLKRNSIDMVILSNHTVNGIETQLRRLGIAKYFSRVLANPNQSDPMKGRNKPEKARKYLSARGYKPREVLFVGDSPEETQIGKSLGARTASITDGYYSTARIKAAKPDYIVHNLADLIKIASQLKKGETR